MNMTDDKQMLELAAIAAGYDYVVADEGRILIRLGSGRWTIWNPRLIDKQALMLAAKLKLRIEWVDDEVTVSEENYDSKDPICASEFSTQASREQELRLAIVRVAALIGQRIKDESALHKLADSDDSLGLKI